MHPKINQSPWLPSSVDHERHTARQFIAYSRKEDVYTLDPFLFASGILPEDIRELTTIGGPAEWEYIDSGMRSARKIIQLRHKAAHGFCELFWTDAQGCCWREVHTRLLADGEWIIGEPKLITTNTLYE